MYNICTSVYISLLCPSYKEPCLVDCLDKKLADKKSRIASDKLYNQQVCIEGRVNQGDRKTWEASFVNGHFHR